MNAQSPAQGRAGAYGLRALALMLGVFFVFHGLDKISWLTDSSLLAQRLEGWLQEAALTTRWYIETVAVPGVPLFARLVPIVEMATGAALILGFWTRMVAGARFSHGGELSLRARRVLQLGIPAGRGRPSRPRRAVGAGARRIEPAVQLQQAVSSRLLSAPTTCRTNVRYLQD